jgi:hypothetical protein
MLDHRRAEIPMNLDVSYTYTADNWNCRRHPVYMQDLLFLYIDGQQAGWRGFDSRQGQDFSLFCSVQNGSGAHPASYPISSGGFFSGGKADHSPPSSAEVKNSGTVPPLPHTSSWRGAQLITLHSCCSYMYTTWGKLNFVYEI